MNKNFLTSPPMGWNSYDYYDTSVTEADVKANADYMASSLKEYGWEYIVVDIEWYCDGAGTRRDEYQYIPFGDVAIDGYSRLMPSESRFPSAAGGAGFAPLAAYVHEKGLKFGIHIMRGIPRIAAHMHMPVKGTDARADEIADPSSICVWNPDMYGLRPDKEASQAYYDSIFELYAEWGVDFVKCDDICRMDAPSAEAEIKMISKAIERCGRPIVLSLSPGPARLDKAWMYGRYSNMWRITDDFWDDWRLLLNMFDRCEQWQDHVKEGGYPDCDMLPIGRIGKGFGNERDTRFTKNEQISMMSLWCIFRSPLMLGCELTKLDSDTLSLITNREVLSLLRLDTPARMLERDDDHVIWANGGGCRYVAMFNISDAEKQICARLPYGGLGRASELWSHGEALLENGALRAAVPAHGAKIFRIEKNV